MSDPISNMLTSIRNAQAVLHQTVEIPFSNLKYELAKILVREGFLERVEKKGRKIKKTLEITLKYITSPESPGKKIPVISELKRVSRPGQRIYFSSKKIRRVKGGYGIAIISTSKGRGLMTDKEARKQKVGGEIICEIW